MQHANDVKMASQIGVDLLGFDFIPQSPRYVKMISSQAGIIPDFSVERLRALSQQANTPQPQPISISRVGVFADDMPQNIVTRVYNFRLDYIQLHGQESPTFIRNLRATLIPDIRPHLKIIKAISIANREDLEQYKIYENDVDLFLFDTKTPLQGGSGQQFDWSLLQSYKGEVPFLLSGGIGPDDVSRIRSLHHPRMIGIDLNSKFETSPGIKDVVLLQNFIQALNSSSDL